MRLKFQADHRILKLLLASDVSCRGLHKRGQEETESVLVRLRAMAQARTSAAKIMGCEMVYTSLPGAPLHRIPDYVGRHASLLSLSTLQNPLNTFPSLTPECSIQALRSSLFHDGTGTVRRRFPSRLK